MNEIIDEVISCYGGVKGVQERFGYQQPMGVYNWRSRGIPRALVAEISVDTGIALPRLLSAVKTVPASSSPDEAA